MIEGPTWVNDAKTALKLVYFEPLILEELFESADNVAALLDSVDHTVHFIADAQRVKRFPPGLYTNFPVFSRHPFITHRNLGKFIVVINNVVVERILLIFSRVYHKLEFVRTMDQAYQAASIEYIQR